MKKHLMAGICMACLGSAAQAAQCNLNVTDLSFGTVMQMDPLPSDVQGTVSVQCQAEVADLMGIPATATVDYVLRLNGGGSGDPAQRRMQGPGAMLAYNIFTDAGRQVVWGDGNNGTVPQTGEFVFSELQVLQGTPQSADFISYARIPANINVAPGAYADAVTVTLVF